MYTYLYIPCVCARGYFYGTMACCESAIPRNRQNVKEATARRNGNDSTERPRTRGGVVGGKLQFVYVCVCYFVRGSCFVNYCMIMMCPLFDIHRLWVEEF